MAIYPERKAGVLTGRFRVEIQKGTTRLRGRAGSLSEAKVVERELTVRMASGVPPVSSSLKSTSCLTMSDGEKRAEGLLWAGQETEAASLRKLKRIVSIVGSDTLLDAFDSNMVDTVIKSLKAADASDATVNRYLSTTSAFLTFCKKRGFKTNEVPEMDWRDEDAGRIRWITYEEEDDLLSILPRQYSEVVWLAIRTGMRASELLSLKPEQVEDQWAHLWKTKNGGSRSIPLTVDMSGRLKALVAEGLPTYPQLRHQWDTARKAMGLSEDPTFVFHACRHTYATRSVQAGVNPVILQKLMGHKTIQTTLRYSHVDDKTLSEAALDALAFHDRRAVNGGRSGGMEEAIAA